MLYHTYIILYLLPLLLNPPNLFMFQNYQSYPFSKHEHPLRFCFLCSSCTANSASSLSTGLLFSTENGVFIWWSCFRSRLCFIWFLWNLMFFSSSSSSSSHFLVHDSSKRITVSNPLGENLVGILEGSSSKDVVILCHGFRCSKVLFYIYVIKKNAMYIWYFFNWNTFV